MARTTVSWRACASSLVTLLLAAGVASCGSATPDHAEPRPGSTPAPRVLGRLSRIQRHNFALLRTPPEGLPARVRRLAPGSPAAANPALAQRIPVTVPGSYWLVPGIGSLCIVSEVPWTEGIATICARTQQAIKYGSGTITFMPAKQAPAGMPTRLLVGIAPDDARTALIHTKGSVAAVPVFNGIFVLRDSLRGPADSIELRRTRGT
jgi:hypothetical protein